MPRISKARIVNFGFNDGRRLIADELFLFESADGREGRNVLVNLANGGGKSVLVQLLMQPVLPKARVANRRIESFFTRPGEHCFIVLEWIKDNSREKLLTGIAMAAREAAAADDDDEESRGMQVKFYTFYAQYAGDGSPYSIVNLPLSRKEGGRFLVAEFDAVRTLSRKSGHALEYYRDDDQGEWQRKIAEYGLIREEWRMIERLNSEEGGFGKYFGEFKSSDALIDRLLIPTIEGKLRRDPVKGDRSLSTMLVSHARAHAAHEEVLKERDRLREFERGLEKLSPLADDLWNAQDARRQCVLRLFGLSDALAGRGDALKAEEEAAQEDGRRLDGRERHIEWERLSEKFYRRQDAAGRADAVWNEARARAEQAGAAAAAARREWEIAVCARYYRKLCQSEGRARSIREELGRRESGAGAGEELGRLKYSAARAAEEARGEAAPQAEEAEARLRAIAEELEGRRAEREAAVKERLAAQTAYDRQDGSLANFLEDTDRAVKALDAGLRRRLDGRYADEELQELSREIERQKGEAETAARENGARLREIGERLAAIPEERAALSAGAARAREERRALQDGLERYRREEAALREIFDEHNQDFSRRFTGLIVEFLTAAKRENRARIDGLRRELAAKNEELAAAERGAVHVPRAVIDYLDAAGVRYEPCERYLLRLAEEKKLSAGDCLELLGKSPALAYGVVMDEGARRQFAGEPRAPWLPALVPLFTYERITALLSGERWAPDAIACYSEASFADRGRYIARLAEERKERDGLLAQLGQRAEHLEEQLRRAAAFQYDADWEKTRRGELGRLDARLKENEAGQAALQKEQERLEGERGRLEQEGARIRGLIERGERRREAFESVVRRLEREEGLQRLLAERRGALDGCRRRLGAVEARIGELEKEREGSEQEAVRLRELLRELDEVAEKVADAADAPREEGGWRELYERYDQCLRSINQAIGELRRQYEEENERRREYERELARYELPEEAYRGRDVSDEQEEERRLRHKSLEAAAAAARGEAEAAQKEQIRTAVERNSLLEDLEPYGGPLDKSEVGGDFEARLEAIRLRREELSLKIRKGQESLRRVERARDRLANCLEGIPRPGGVRPEKLEEAFEEQCGRGRRELLASKKRLDGLLERVRSDLRDMGARFPASSAGISEAIGQMANLIENPGAGDAFYTLTEHIGKNRENTLRAIARIDTDLREFEHGKEDLIRHCLLQGEVICAGLRQMESSSRVLICDGRPRQEMIRFDLPEEAGLDPDGARARIVNELERGVKELAAAMRRGGATEAEIKKCAERTVGSRNLLRRYAGRESIPVKAYKIDQNARNSGYRTWEQTLVNNSGAEKFVVYFSVILALINYARSEAGEAPDRGRHSVLILDNPFGATSSKHILDPMFQIARHFRVQLICLSDINKTDILNCFDIVIKALVKRRPMSSHELLTHEGNERIEHGFYRSEGPLLF